MYVHVICTMHRFCCRLVSIIYAIMCSVGSMVILWQARNDMLRGQ